MELLVHDLPALVTAHNSELESRPSPLDAFIAPQGTLEELLNRVGVNRVGDVKRNLEEEVKMVEDNYSLIKRAPSSLVRSL